MKNLEDFLCPTQKQLFKRLCKKFKGKTLISKGNFILVHGQAPVMLVAHLDTVHKQPVRDICTTADGNILMSPQGVGGDDRCGVFALVKIYKSAQVKPWLLFTCDEEVGGIGAQAFCLAHKQKQLPKEIDSLKFIIEIDRRGSNDAVFYRCANQEFETYINGKGLKTAQGSFSDISLIAPELGVAAVNLSSGYYAAHTLHEYINRKELDDTIGRIIDIIADVHKLPRFEFIEHIQPVEPSKLIRLDDSIYLPRRVPADLQDIYEFLLDFYSVNELESFRVEYGDQILWQIYQDEVAYFHQ
ncbi:MAG: hypothetical protein IJQ82_01430 [Selenomonadaceae bacterium]|nr:hypothetical protein [Selenomonadaceae bacterium]